MSPLDSTRRLPGGNGIGRQHKIKVGVKVLRIILGWGWEADRFSHQGKTRTPGTGKEGRTTIATFSFAMILLRSCGNLIQAFIFRAAGRKGRYRHNNYQ